MGTWGVGNFDADEPRDFIRHYIDNIAETIEGLLSSVELHDEDFLLGYGDTQILPSIEIMVALCTCMSKRFWIYRDRANMKSWRQRYLQIYDQYAHEAYLEGVIQERREVIEKTFDRLDEVARD